MFVFCFVFLFSNFVYSVFLYFCFVLCISPFVYNCPFPISAPVYRQLPPGGNPFAVNKYHIISKRNSEKERVKILTGEKCFRTVSGLCEHGEEILGIT